VGAWLMVHRQLKPTSIPCVLLRMFERAAVQLKLMKLLVGV
jgi:hypothetical protein